MISSAGDGTQSFGHLTAGEPQEHDPVAALHLGAHGGDHAHLVVGVGQGHEESLRGLVLSRLRHSARCPDRTNQRRNVSRTPAVTGMTQAVSKTNPNTLVSAESGRMK